MPKSLQNMFGLTSMSPGIRDSVVGQTRFGPLPKLGTMVVLTEMRVEAATRRYAARRGVARSSGPGVEEDGVEVGVGSEGVKEFDSQRRIVDGGPGIEKDGVEVGVGTEGVEEFESQRRIVDGDTGCVRAKEDESGSPSGGKCKQVCSSTTRSPNTAASHMGSPGSGLLR